MDDRMLWLVRDTWNNRWYILALSAAEASLYAEKLAEDESEEEDVAVVVSVNWISDDVFEA